MHLALELSQVEKIYGAHKAVDGLSLAVAPGQCFALLGPNGAGKTTTLRLALGLINSDQGDIRLLGYRLPQQSRLARQRVGVVPQFDNLDPDFSAAENLLVYGRYFSLNSHDIKRRIPELLDFVGLGAKANAPVSTLSGGMKRRLTLARALINDPEMIFLDEPTTGLDPQARHLIWQRLRELTLAGKTLLLTTHFMEEAERLASQIAVIDHGKLINQGSAQQLIREHIEAQVVEIYGEQAQDWLNTVGHKHLQRSECVGETVFCYGDNLDALIALLQQQQLLRYLHRPANLEDVFLKLTGRDLRD